MKNIYVFLFLMVSISNIYGQSSIEYFYSDEEGNLFLSRQGASHFASLALNCIQKEYPNKKYQADTINVSPREVHPAFYGCYDWHSSVHGHWMLIRLMKLFPGLPEKEMIFKNLSQNLTKAKIAKECEYFQQPENESFERMYGWAWLLKLSEEIFTWNSIFAEQLEENLKPLTDIIVRRYFEYLPHQQIPVTNGVHTNTAFSLSFGLDFARTTGNDSLEKLIIQKSKSYFLDDTDCTAEWEPGREDFFSPCLLEAELMSNVLTATEFESWFNKFFPEITQGKPEVLFDPAVVSDRSDHLKVHLDGLNLSRAWCMFKIAKALPKEYKGRGILLNSAYHHLNVTIPYVASGEYAGEHWLASFAVYTLAQE